MSSGNGQQLQESILALRRGVVVAISNKNGRKVPPQAIASLDSGASMENVVGYALEHGKKKRRSITSVRPKDSKGKSDQPQKRRAVGKKQEVSEEAAQTVIVSGRRRPSLLVVTILVITIISLAIASYIGWPYLAEIVVQESGTR